MNQLQLSLSFEDFIPKNHLREIDDIIAQENRIYLDEDLEELGENRQFCVSKRKTVGTYGKAKTCNGSGLRNQGGIITGARTAAVVLMQLNVRIQIRTAQSVCPTGRHFFTG